MEAGADRIEYAEMLVGFFEAASANRSRRANWGVAMATGASVERRVERIINWSAAAKITSRVRVGLLLLMPIAALAASAMPGAAAVAPSVNEPPVERTVAVVASVPSEGTGVGTHTPAPSQPSVAAAPAMVAAAPGDPQMAVLLFDLAVPSDTRGRMIDAVRRQVAESRVRFDAGLELGHVSRVVAVGDQTSILQDFTGDPDKVDAALTRVAALTTSLADRSARIAAIGRVCREVSALPVTNAYFNDWPELYKKLQIGVRSPITLDSTSRRVDYFVAAEWLTPEERRRVQESCQFANLLYREVAVERTPGQASAARPMDPVGRHTALIFDGTLVERERERATALANQIIAELGPYEAISVVASGAAPEVVQDFTGDKSLLRGAVARAAALVAAPNSSAGWRSVRNTCASMTEVGPTSAAGLFALIERAGRLMLVFPGDQRVFYFSAAVERGVISPRDMRDIAADCSDVRRSFFVFDAGWISPVYGANGPVSTGLRQIGYDLGVGLDVAPRQPNCPLTLATEKTAFDNGYASVIVSNASQKTVGRVTLGLVLTPNDASQMVPTVLLAQGVSMPLQPGERIDIATRLLEGKLFALLARQGALVEVGVVAVDFTDGTKWTYDLQSRGRFERH
jgi:hypothetical protein